MQRPQSATVFGILNIAWGAMGLLGLIVGVIAMHLAPSNPSMQLLNQSPVLKVWTTFTMPLGFVSCIVLAIAGIGLLLFKNWGRILSIIYAIYTLVFGVIGLFITAIFMTLPMIEKAQQSSGPESIGMMAGAIGGLIGGVLGLIYPVLLLIFMLRPKFIEAFRMAQQPPTQPQFYPPAV